MGFISDLLIEISSFRIRIGNKLNSLKTLIDSKANIDGSNIPAGTFWHQFKAGGVGNYIYVDVQENDFSRVMVWKNGGWAWTNKSGFQTWAGIGFPSDLETTYKTDLVGAINEVNGNIPTNHITTDTNQTGLTGNKSVDGTWTFNSQINTVNHGNSSQWKQAYDWGDFRDYGLGTVAVVNTGLFANINETGFYAFSTSQQGFTYPRAMLMKRGSQNYGLIFSSNGDIVGFLTGDGSTYTAWHSGNFNPAQYVLQSSLNTQLANYATLAGTQTFTGQNTFTTAIYIPAGTLNGHAVNLGQLNTILGDYATETWVNNQNFSTQTLTAGANIQIVGNVISATDTNTTYTGSNGINVAGTVISPTYGTTANTIAQGDDARINNGQTAFGWGDYSLWGLGAGVINNPVISSDLFAVTGTGFFRYSENALNIPDSSNGSFITIMRNSNYVSRLAFSDSGKIFYTYGNYRVWREFWTNANFNPAQYVLQSALNTQLANYATLAGTQTFTGQNTFTQAPIVPNATLNGHAVNLGQLNTILGDYATESWVTQQINNISLTPGPQGPQGVKGDKGDKGDTGSQGIQGVKGDKGDKGDTGTQGIQGIQGIPGTPGTNGTNGTNGADGKTILSGTSNPTGATGTIGDWYLNRTTWTMFEKTGATTWTNRGVIKGADGTNGTNGLNGVDGSKWLNGTSNPASGTGVVGDWYVNTSTWNVYEKTGASTWTLRGNIKGAQGSQGPQGPQGPAGPAGSSGPVEFQVIDTSFGNYHISTPMPVNVYHIRGNDALHISVDDGNADGQLLHLPVCGTPEVIVDDWNAIDKCGYQPPAPGSISGGSSWVWSASHGIWIQTN